jgi:hypothetical protein
LHSPLKPYPPLGSGILARVYAGGKWLRILVCPPKLGAPASLLVSSSHWERQHPCWHFLLLPDIQTVNPYFVKALPAFGSRDSSPRLRRWQVVTDPSLPTKLRTPASLLAFSLLPGIQTTNSYFAKALPAFGSRDSSPRLRRWQVVTDSSLPTKTRNASISAAIFLTLGTSASLLVFSKHWER